MADQAPPTKKKPTHFLCLRITNPDIVAAATNLQQELVKVEPGFEPSILRPELLHVTLMVLGLKIQEACKMLEAMQPQFEKLNLQNVSLDFNGTDKFREDVLFGSMKKDSNYEKFCAFVKDLRAPFKEQKMARGFESNQFHMTLLQFKNEERGKYNLGGYKFFRITDGKYFGKQRVNNVYLCEMPFVSKSKGVDKDPDGFYVTCTHVDF